MKTKSKKNPVTKMIDHLDAIAEIAHKMSSTFTTTSYEKKCFFSNVAYDLHKIVEELDEYNLNNPE